MIKILSEKDTATRSNRRVSENLDDYITIGNKTYPKDMSKGKYATMYDPRDVIYTAGKDYNAEANADKIKSVKLMHEIMMSMNDEEAYYSWIYTMPDSPTTEDFLYYVEPGNEEAYEDLKDTFERIYKQFHKSGLYLDRTEKRIEDAAHEYDEQFGLDPIEVFYPKRESINESYVVSEGILDTIRAVVPDKYEPREFAKKILKILGADKYGAAVKDTFIDIYSTVGDKLDKALAYLVDNGINAKMMKRALPENVNKRK